VKDLLFALLIALAWFAAIDAALSALAAAAYPLVGRAVPRLRPSSAAAVLLSLKLAPGAAASLFILAAFLPAQYRFEPRNVEESAGYTVMALGVAGAATLALAARRAWRDWAATRRLQRRWLAAAGAARIVTPDGLPVYCVRDRAPMLSMSGVRRPRVFVSRRVFEALSAAELEASLAHERAHGAAADNLKRLVVACSPDMLGLWRQGREIERGWREAVEFAADARARSGSEGRGLLLASALLKVARMTSEPELGARAAASAFHDGAPIWDRISRLLAAEVGEEPAPRLGRGWSCLLCGATLSVAIAAAEAVWLGVHVVTEGLIRFLP
jgi:Zn-dependent protease with chaperone function